MKIEEGCYYHIYNRGNNRGLIYFQDSDYHFFLEQFEKYVKSSIKIYVYCLMPNHFHLFVRVEDKLTFEKGLKNFFIAYVKYINFKYDRTGSLFQGRYKASKIKSDSYFTRIITYIRQNPLVFPIITKPEEYPYSSYREYLSVDHKYSFLSKEEVIEWFGNLDKFIIAHEDPDFVSRRLTKSDFFVV